MKNEMMERETIQARLEIIKLLKLAIAETCKLNKQLDDMHDLLHRTDTLKKAA
jgi:hypothetical protein